MYLAAPVLQGHDTEWTPEGDRVTHGFGRGGTEQLKQANSYL